VEVVISVFIMFSVLMSGLAIGVTVPFLFEIKNLREDLKNKIAEFDEITKRASEANLSHANKLLQLEDKVANFEFRLQTSMPTSTFKAK
jgi:hypothetical protein